ncbi:MAG: ribosome biogenesis GTPase YlqF [Mogibacterium sp.]|nr:ribosome biogenesis GTPase YlqF [Mogibacterium sp.]
MSDSINNINWYPGHMKKTRELIRENLKMVDLVVELVDSRIPVSSRNPIIDELTQGKPRLILLNKADLADPAETERWKAALLDTGKASKGAGNSAGVVSVLAMDSRSGDNLKAFYKVLEGIQAEVNARRQRNRPLRMMIVGVPNVGKSSFINRLAGKRSAKTGDKPGVTRGKQWIALENGMQLLDTPGILWPKFEDRQVGLNLAFCGSIKDEVMNAQDLGFELIKVLGTRYPDNLKERYKLDEVSDDALTNMEAIATKRGFLMPGRRIDYERTGRTVLDEFRTGKLGRITLEPAPAKE